MNALIIAVAVLVASVTLSVAEATPVNSYRNLSPSCGTVEPSCGTVNQDSNGGCTCSGSWQPRCSCPNPQNCPHPRRYNLRPCSCKPPQPTTFHLPSCSAPPVATTPIPYQIIQYSPCSTSSSPDPPCSDTRPCSSPSPAPVAVLAGPPSCAAQQLPCPFYASQQQPSCSCGGPPSSANGPSDFTDEVVPLPTPCLAPPQLPPLPKFIPFAPKPLSFNIHRPSAPCRPGIGVYGGPAPSLFSLLGCGSPSPYQSYNYK